MVFSSLLAPIHSGAVLDIGCGTAGLYWAMGYADRVSSLSFLDCQKVQIQELEDQLSLTTPEYIESNFGDTIAYLKPGLPLDKVSFAMASCLQENSDAFLVSDIAQPDISITSYSRKWQHVVALQSLQCLASLDEFEQALCNISQLLAKEGTFCGTLLHYHKVTSRVEELRKHRLEGYLQLTTLDLEQLLLRHNFQITLLSEQVFPEMGNYQKVLSFRAVNLGGTYAIA